MSSHYDQLEQIIDESNLAEVIKRIARICYEKAEHIESNWQDEQTSRAWERAGARLGSVAENRAIQNVS